MIDNGLLMYQNGWFSRELVTVEVVGKKGTTGTSAQTIFDASHCNTLIVFTFLLMVCCSILILMFPVVSVDEEFSNLKADKVSSLKAAFVKDGKIDQLYDIIVIMNSFWSMFFTRN